MSDTPGDPTFDESAEEASAAAEAGAIGGEPSRNVNPDVDPDPAQQAVSEGGGGEAEGFELAEEELRENAEQGPVVPEAEVKAVRAEVDRETEEEDPATYGEADAEQVSEVQDDDR